MIFGGGYNTLDDTLTEYESLISGGGWNTVEKFIYKIISTGGKIKWLRIVLSGAPGAGKKYTFTLMLNGAPTALTFDIADAATSGSDMVNEVAVSGGDTVSIRCVPTGTPTVRYAYWTCVFEGDNAKESLILGGTYFDVDRTNIEYAQVMGATSFHTVTENNFRQVCPTAGVIKNLYVLLSEDPGTAPEAYRFTLRRNGISQALTVTITADNVLGIDLVNTVNVVAGDVLTLMIEPLNSPVENPYACWGMTFVADVDGESIVLGGSYDPLDNAATEYNQLTCFEGLPWIVNENERYMLGQTCTVMKLYMLLSAAPGAGNKYDFTIRTALADSNVVAKVEGANITGNSGALNDTVADDDYVDLKVVPDDTPDAANAYWGFVCYTGAPLGWTGKISGVTNPAEIAGVPVANIAEVKGVT